MWGQAWGPAHGLQAYSPLCKAEKLDDPRLVAMASRLGITTARLLLRWSVQKGFIPLPKSVNPERQVWRRRGWGPGGCGYVPC